MVQGNYGKCMYKCTYFSISFFRATSTSKAKVKGLTLKNINKAAGWISDSTFPRFYNTPGDENLGDCIIEFDEHHINWIVWVLIFITRKFNPLMPGGNKKVTYT